MLLATSRCVKPLCAALVRSTVDVQFRLIEGLLDAQVGDAGNLRATALRIRSANSRLASMSLPSI